MQNQLLYRTLLQRLLKTDMCHFWLSLKLKIQKNT